MFRLFIIFILYASSLYANTFVIDSKTVQETEKKYGVLAKKRLVNLVALLNELESKSKPTQLEKINDFFNAMAFETDLKVWHEKDYWASRDEFMGVDSGDCEDYSIAKYFSLKQLGFSDEQIFLTYVKAVKYRQSHMVMTYYKTPRSIPLVLDNINKKILPANKRRDLRPIFNFNGDKIYMAKQRGLGRVVPKGKINLSKWSELILKIKREKQ